MWKLKIGLNHRASRIQMPLPEVQVLFYNLAYTPIIEINICLLIYTVQSLIAYYISDYKMTNVCVCVWSVSFS